MIIYWYTHIGQHGFEFLITSYSDSVSNLIFILKNKQKQYIFKMLNILTNF